jgi:hypothetical protein
MAIQRVTRLATAHHKTGSHVAKAGPYQADSRCAFPCLLGTFAVTQQMVLHIGPGLMPDFMTGSLFHSIIAWPTAKESEPFHRIGEELMADVIRQTRQIEPAGVSEFLVQWPQIDWLPIVARSWKLKPAFGYLNLRLKQRMAAARAGIGMMHQQLFGMPAELPAGMSAASIDQLCRLIRSDVKISDPENVEKLVWRKSLPILHLAIAAQLLLAGKYGDRTNVGADLQDQEFYREAVQLGAVLEQVVDAHPAIAMTRERMTLVRWVD